MKVLVEYCHAELPEDKNIRKHYLNQSLLFAQDCKQVPNPKKSSVSRKGVNVEYESGILCQTKEFWNYLLTCKLLKSDIDM